MSNSMYWQGYAQACLERGVNPQLLQKSAVQIGGYDIPEEALGALAGGGLGAGIGYGMGGGMGALAGGLGGAGLGAGGVAGARALGLLGEDVAPPSPRTAADAAKYTPDLESSMKGSGGRLPHGVQVGLPPEGSALARRRMLYKLRQLGMDPQQIADAGDQVLAQSILADGPGGRQDPGDPEGLGDLGLLSPNVPVGPSPRSLPPEERLF